MIWWRYTACSRTRANNAENDSGVGVGDDGPAGVLRGALASESKAAGGAVD